MTHFKKKKSLGQHFLKSPSAVRTMVLTGNLVPGELVLEIGPGMGVLTEALLETGVRVIAVEKDTRLIAHLQETFKEHCASGMLTILHEDVLEIDLLMVTGGRAYKLIANIPYYITGALFRLFLETEHQPQAMILLVQKEVAMRIVARDKKESVLSQSVKAYGTPKIEKIVPRGAFSPPPNVDSAILAIRNISRDFFSDFTEAEFFQWLKTGFAHKRKKLIGNLEAIMQRTELEELFQASGINTAVRAEDISLEDWKKLLTRKEHGQEN